MDADRLRADGDFASADGRHLALGDRAQALGRGGVRVLGLVLAGDDEAAVVGIVEIGVELRDEAMAASGVDLLVQRAEHAEQRRLEYVRGVADRVSHVLDPRRHPVQGAVRLDVVERHALRVEKPLQRADLVDEAIGQFLAADLHFAAAEALQVRQRRMRADLDAMGLGEPDRRAHVVEVGGMEAAGDIGDVDVRHQAGVVAQTVEPEGLAHVAVDRRHSRPPAFLDREKVARLSRYCKIGNSEDRYRKSR